MKKEFLINTALVISSLVFLPIVVIAGEFVVRLTTKTNYSGFSKELFIRNAYGESKGYAKNAQGIAYGVKVYTDQYGFRVPKENPDDKKPPQDAVLLLGDSIGFGPGVEEEETIAGRLRRGLATTKIYNSSVASYNTFDYKNIIEHFLPGHSDIKRVFLLYCLNDVESISSQLIDEYLISKFKDSRKNQEDNKGNIIERIRDVPWIKNTHNFLRTKSKLYLLIKNVLTRPQYRYWSEITKYYSDAYKEYFATVMKPVGEIADELNTRNIEFTVIILPYSYQLMNTDPALRRPQEKLAAFFESRGIHYIDSIDHLSATEISYKKLFLPYDPDHLTSRGHKIIYKTIMEELSKND